MPLNQLRIRQSRPLAHANVNTNTIHAQNLHQYNIQDAYTQLQQTYNALLEEHSTLKLNFHDLNTKLSESKDAFNTLCNAMHLRTSVSGPPSILASLSGSSLSTSSMPHEKLEKDDYPGVRFWTRADWTEFDDNTDANEDLGRGMRFLEDKDGSARSIWNQISASNASLLPTSWGQAGLDLRQLFNKQMRAEFKEFQYCEADWKAIAFATEYYPNWYRKHANGCKVKSEDCGVRPDATSINSRKRPPTSKPDPTRKKAKLSTTPEWSSSTPVDLSNDSLDVSAQSTPPPELVAAQMNSSDTLSDVAKGKRRAEFKVPDPLSEIDMSTPSPPPVSIIKSLLFSSAHRHPSSSQQAAPSKPIAFALSSSLFFSPLLPVPPKPIVSTSDSISSAAVASGSTALLDSAPVLETVSTSSQTPITNDTDVNTPESQSDLTNVGSSVAESKSEIAIESSDKSRPGRKRKAGMAPGKMRVTDSKTPRNLCARAWKEQHPNGLTNAYEKYWNELNDADRKIWTDKSAKLKEMRKL
ncbi:hypothetical protein PILCRDRAFT_10980 [Piloderma croceum F 1598]|uniref:Uncharacterized protein n=1 Tax=Piloderma croceum (strain F 1598) TaxID=765440 RepID=A0A0C3FG19_PILCF|nr:hypothetical protein PILCRDRAFT_10980 [Piloderma croceum F 1598]